MIKSKKLLAVGIIAALGLAACGSDDDASSSSEAPAGTEATEGTEAPAGTEAPTGTDAAGEGDCAVGVVYDITGRGDSRSTTPPAPASTRPSPNSASSPASRPRPATATAPSACRASSTRATTSSSASASSSATRSPKRPPTTPTPASASSTPSSTRRTWRRSSFAEEQGSFLVGAAAALKSQTGTIGFIGGVENDLIKKFEAGYTAGAKAVNPDIEILVNYITQPPDFTGFNDPAKGKEIAASQYEAGADVIYAAAGGSGLGVFEAAAEAGEPGEVWAIGVDSDQYELVSPELQPYVLTSMLKKVDVATYETIRRVCEGGVRSWRADLRPRRSTASATRPRVASSTTSPTSSTPSRSRSSPARSSSRRLPELT